MGDTTTQTIAVAIGETGEGFTQLSYPESDVSITTQPESGTASIQGLEEPGGAFVTKLLVVNSTPGSTQNVAITIAVRGE
jgi:VCBS repeat-containing protein